MAQWKRPGPLQRAGIANSRVFFAAIFAKPFLGRHWARESPQSPHPTVYDAPLDLGCGAERCPLQVSMYVA
jgi:hypothetical protein